MIMATVERKLINAENRGCRMSFFDCEEEISCRINFSLRSGKGLKLGLKLRRLHAALFLFWINSGNRTSVRISTV